MKQFVERRFPLKLNLQTFAEGGDGGAGGDGGGDGGNGGNGGGAGGGAGGGDEKKFTQAELDQHVQSRLSRAEKAAQKALAKELGFDSIEAMTAAFKKGEKKNGDDNGDGKGKGDDDKLAFDPAELDRLVDEKLKAKEQQQNEKTFKRLLNAEVKVLANELGFADWEDALSLSDLSKVKENDKGELEGVKEALEELGKKKPHLLKVKPTTGRFGANVPNSPEQKKKSKEKLVKLAQSRGIAPGTQASYNPWADK